MVLTTKVVNQASVKLERATKKHGKKAAKTAETKKKKALQRSKRPVEEVSHQTAQMRSDASSDSSERPLATIATIQPSGPRPKRNMVLAYSYSESYASMEPPVPMKKPVLRGQRRQNLSAIPIGAAQAFIPEIPEGEEADGSQAGGVFSTAKRVIS
ncbi:hypothetical protein F511_27114 [Dorcoceras hygrometricum]|uniref:Uncharacterized protein n=1 Tax=Dorcoceras hygrometricum TaxID=472368 RepID=A0A2Z7CGN0_9LAMI|nr:hypothetical protein F511_27114 [Dorcoceras hygrometricum]